MECFLTHALEKVFPDRKPRAAPNPRLMAFGGEIPALQLVYFYDDGKNGRPFFSATLRGAQARFRLVDLIPSDYPAYYEKDEGYLTDKPGLFPDLLSPMEDTFRVIPGQYRAIWVDFPKLPEPGEYALEIALQNKESGEEYHLPFTLCVLPHALGEQFFPHTEWFHADCLADYYDVPAFGGTHWLIVENFIMRAAELRINMLLTPVFTPPLDTAVGHERTTVQLLDVEVVNGSYLFSFSRLEKWCRICRRHGIKYLEIPPFFTQWGAEFTPKIMARINGMEEQIFGWHVEAGDPEYRAFLKALLPSLQSALENFGYDRAHVYYHISDEPAPEQLDSYHIARSQIIDLLEGNLLIDALSDYAFYEKGLVPLPVVANDHIQTFADKGVENYWAYYCCGQKLDVPNRFFALPSARNRIMGVLMYLYNIKGFLHWGYNFYSAQHSLRPIDPYRNTHADYAFPSGDAFLVYPGARGAALSSLRAENQRGAIEDYLMLQKAESLLGREKVENILREGFDRPMTFTDYPKDPAYLLDLRQRIARSLRENG